MSQWGKGICSTCKHKNGNMFFSCSNYELSKGYNYDADTCTNYEKEKIKSEIN